ncbi:MAG TPA: hypothetical protein VLJ11_06200 [Bryobacteraceae bacterium]|nr:hypothetical protein [Bryobacteraceae bacterium]
MDSEDYHEFEDESARLGDGWDDFRCDDGDPISIKHLKLLPLAEMPADVRLLVLDNYFPELEQAAELAVQ